MKELIYSKETLAKIRLTDPQLVAMSKQWEIAFGRPVEAKMVEGRLVVKPRSENKSLS